MSRHVEVRGYRCTACKYELPSLPQSVPLSNCRCDNCDTQGTLIRLFSLKPGVELLDGKSVVGAFAGIVQDPNQIGPRLMLATTAQDRSGVRWRFKQLRGSSRIDYELIETIPVTIIADLSNYPI